MVYDQERTVRCPMPIQLYYGRAVWNYFLHEGKYCVCDPLYEGRTNLMQDA